MMQSQNTANSKNNSNYKILQTCATKLKSSRPQGGVARQLVRDQTLSKNGMS